MQALSTDELLNFSIAETRHWREWFSTNPAVLDIEIDIAQTKNVRELIMHIVLVELRYSERLLEKSVTEYSEAPINLNALFSIGDRAMKNLRSFMSKASNADWDKILTFPTRSAGTLTASKRKIFVHALLHGMRHWAQIATILRQQGYKQPWPHDFLFTDVMP